MKHRKTASAATAFLLALLVPAVALADLIDVEPPEAVEEGLPLVPMALVAAALAALVAAFIVRRNKR